jgi:type I restriction enzyme S subunit
MASQEFIDKTMEGSKGTHMPRADWEHIESWLLPLPKPPVQRKIAYILSSLDEKIELNRRMAATLEEMARAIFKSWFIDFDPVRAKSEGRPTGLPPEIDALFPDEFEESELGDMPVGWKVETLGDLITTIKGRSYKSEELLDSETALVTLKSFARGGGYRPDGLKAFTGSYKPDQIVQPGDLVIACTDVTQAAEVIGRPAIVRGTGGYRRLVASLDTLIVRPRTVSLTLAFLYFMGRNNSFVAHMLAHTTGTTVLHLAKEAVPSFRFAFPTAQLLKQFDKLASSALQLIQTLEEESECLTEIRNTLLPKLISGELSLKNSEINCNG